MKTIALIALALGSFAVAAPSLKASDYHYITAYKVTTTHCAPYFIGTKEVCRHTECRYAYDHCGRRYSYHVVVVTFADVYSDGSSRTYKKVFRA